MKKWGKIEKVSKFPMDEARQDITVIPADEPSNKKLGWVIYEQVGVAVVNDYAVSMLNLMNRIACGLFPGPEELYD